MLIQIHMLQNYAPANLNRDDTGSPKDAIFGGFRRSRISSQCLKRSIRRSDIFRTAFGDDGLLADRTQHLPKLIRPDLAALGATEEEQTVIAEQLTKLGGGKGSDDLKTKVLVFLSKNERKLVAQKLWDLYQDVGEKAFAKLKAKDIDEKLKHDTPRSVDVSMFGRMTTSEAFDDVAAAVQVAHALSVNALDREFDYFTAVDDLSGESGAGMIGDVEFNSSTYYKYFNVHWEQLVENLGGDTEIAAQTVSALIRAAALAQPSGKQNSFAAQNLPDLVLIECTDTNIPVNYANAFLEPVKAYGKNQTLMTNAIEKLNEYVGKIDGAYGLGARRAYFTTTAAEMTTAADKQSLPNLQEWTAQQVTEAAHA